MTESRARQPPTHPVAQSNAMSGTTASFDGATYQAREPEGLGALVAATRQAFVEGSFDEGLARAAYAAYANVPNLDVFLDRARILFPALNCGLCSVYLRSLLGEGEVVRGRYNSHPHTFLSVNGTIIDITADQFGGRATYIGPLVPPWTVM